MTISLIAAATFSVSPGELSPGIRVIVSLEPLKTALSPSHSSSCFCVNVCDWPAASVIVRSPYAPSWKPANLTCSHWHPRR